jgi:hypothetical protein
MRLVSLAVIATALVGCGLLPAALPEWVANRQPLPSCGEESHLPGSTNVEARRCLLQAFEQGRGAELVSTQQITDERTVTRYMRVHENGTIELFVDATKDPLGSGSWERETCGQMLPAEEVRDVWIEEVFIILDCDEQPIP